jgi:hypothetical protein
MSNLRQSDASEISPGDGIPPVTLGETLPSGLAPALFVLVERGVHRKPEEAAGLRATVELSADGHPPVRIDFRGAAGVTVHDGPASEPDVRVQGPLGEIVGLLTTPLLGGIPSPLNRRGRAALGQLRGGKIRLQGSLGLTRRFLGLIRIETTS